jgi:hypothetical protein
MQNVIPYSRFGAKTRTHQIFDVLGSEVNFFVCNFVVNWTIKVIQLSEFLSPRKTLMIKKIKKTIVPLRSSCMLFLADAIKKSSNYEFIKVFTFITAPHGGHDL